MKQCVASIITLSGACAGLASIGCSNSMTVVDPTDSKVSTAIVQPLPGEAQDELPESLADLPPIVEPWIWGFIQGRKISTTHYEIYTTIPYDSIRDRLPGFLEQCLDKYCTALTDLPRPKRKLQTFLFRNRDEWEVKTKQMLPNKVSTYLRLGRGGYTTRGTAVLYHIDRRERYYDTFAIAAHEGWHQYTQQMFDDRLPDWLEEGIATYMEGTRVRRDGVYYFNPRSNSERKFALHSAQRSRNGLIPLRELISAAPQDILNRSRSSFLHYYGQVWALTRFLVEYEDGRYRESFSQLLNDALEGKMRSRIRRSVRTLRKEPGVTVDNAYGDGLIMTYFNADFEEFEQQYDSFASELMIYRRRRAE